MHLSKNTYMQEFSDELKKSYSCNYSEIKPLWNRFKKNLKKDFFKKTNAIHSAKELSYAIDLLIEKIIYETFKNKNNNTYKNIPISIFATGSYGKNELAPYSDIDILFLVEDEKKHTEIIQKILYLLWDLNIKIGHSVHDKKSILKAAKKDNNLLTSLLTLRKIYGNDEITKKLKEDLQNEIIKKNPYSFVLKKTKEREILYSKYGDAKLILEPNIKEGKGTIRDLHVQEWISQYLYSNNVQIFVKKNIWDNKQYKQYTDAYNFLFNTRFALHYASKKLDNLLTFDIQPEVAKIMRYGKIDEGVKPVENFMKDYFIHVINVTNLLEHTLEKIKNKFVKIDSKNFINIKNRFKNFIKINDKISVVNKNNFLSNENQVFEYFALAEKLNLNCEVEILYLINSNLKKIKDKINIKTRKIFVKIISGKNNPERILRIMNNNDLITFVLDDWKNIKSQMQYDRYHSYTTDEHTIKAIGTLNKIAKKNIKNVSKNIIYEYKKIYIIEELYMALLLHDIGKNSGQDHSIAGEKIAKKKCPLFGFDKNSTFNIAWLIKEHLTMSFIAQRRDINDVETIKKFAQIVQYDLNKLRMITLLTVCDLNAVGKNTWNSFKDSLISKLFENTKNFIIKKDSKLFNEEKINNSILEITKKIKKELTCKNKNKIINDFITSINNKYILNNNIDDIVLNFFNIQNRVKNKKTLSIKNRIDYNKNYTDIFVSTKNNESYMHIISGCLTIMGAEILSAKINLINDMGTSYIFRVITKQKEAFLKKEELIVKKIELALNKIISIEDEIEKNRNILYINKNIFPVNTRVEIDNDTSINSSLIIIKTNNDIGILFKITQALAKLKLQIVFAKIATYGTKVVDTFYVKDSFGFKIKKEITKNTIINEIKSVLKT